jgi:hypothetical protein
MLFAAANGTPSSATPKALNRCVTSSMDHTLRLWDLQSGESLRVVEMGAPVLKVLICAADTTNLYVTLKGDVAGERSNEHIEPSSSKKGNGKNQGKPKKRWANCVRVMQLPWWEESETDAADDSNLEGATENQTRQLMRFEGSAPVDVAVRTISGEGAVGMDQDEGKKGGKFVIAMHGNEVVVSFTKDTENNWM